MKIARICSCAQVDTAAVEMASTAAFAKGCLGRNSIASSVEQELPGSSGLTTRSASSSLCSPEERETTAFRIRSYNV
jgi:hypothetical protein